MRIFYFLIVVVIGSYYAAAMNNAGIHKYIKGSALISRVHIKNSNFSYLLFQLNNFHCWNALVVEPYYSLTIFEDGEVIRTSPLRQIIKSCDEFLIQTRSGTIYHVPDTKLLRVSTLRDLKQIFEKFVPGSKELELYKRMPIYDIKKRINNGNILIGQSYKLYEEYYHCDEHQIFAKASKSFDLNEGEILYFAVPSKEDLDCLFD